MKELQFWGRREPRYGHMAPFVATPRLLAVAALEEGQYVQFRPPWLFLRGFAPEAALLRVDGEPIETYQQEAALDAVVVTDPTVVNEVNVTAGLKPKGLLLVNGEIPSPLPERARVIARDLAGIATAHQAELAPVLVGAVVALTGLVRLETVERLLQEKPGGEGKGRARSATLAALQAGFAVGRET